MLNKFPVNFTVKIFICVFFVNGRLHVYHTSMFTCNKYYYQFLVNAYRDTVHDESSNATTIPEVDGREPVPSTSQAGEPMKKKIKLDIPDNVTYFNSPVSTAGFVDAESKLKKCAVSLQLLNGITEIELDIVEENDDQVLKVTYNWPSHLVNTKEMFRKEDGTLLLPSLHPMVLALENSLMSVRANVEDIPCGTINIKLPVKVKTDVNGWDKMFNKMPNGAIMVFLSFIAEENDYTVTKLSKTLKFD